jgi:hypothetical protein
MRDSPFKREILSEMERFSLFWRESDPVENVCGENLSRKEKERILF